MTPDLSISSGSPAPPDPFGDNVFPRPLLEALAEHDDGALSYEPDDAGPWRVHPVEEEAWGLFREGDAPTTGDRPAGVFAERARALLFAVALPAASREPSFAVRDTEDGRELVALVENRLAVVGRLWEADTRTLDAARVLEAVARSPLLLADLLEAAGPSALLRAGRLLFRRLVRASTR